MEKVQSDSLQRQKKTQNQNKKNTQHYLNRQQLFIFLKNIISPKTNKNPGNACKVFSGPDGSACSEWEVLLAAHLTRTDAAGNLLAVSRFYHE